jgi:glycosyltransferase involved in cell wall biosynthesis
MDGSRSSYARKKSLFTGIRDMTIITPSRWLAGLVKQSYLQQYPVEVVYNTIDTNVFKPSHSDFREKHSLAGKKMLLGVASIWTDKKGLSDFIKLSEKLDDSFRIVLVGIAPEQAAKLPENILALPKTNSPKELAQIYTAADLFVNPTYEDTYPTVNLEARACGTRILCYNTCGCAETLTEADILIPRGDTQRLLDAVEEYFRLN